MCFYDFSSRNYLYLNFDGNWSSFVKYYNVALFPVSHNVWQCFYYIRFSSSLSPRASRCSAHHRDTRRVCGIQLPRWVPRRSSRAVCVAMGEEGRRHGRIFPHSALCLWWPSDSDEKKGLVTKCGAAAKVAGKIWRRIKPSGADSTRFLVIRVAMRILWIVALVDLKML